ncbi:site-specific integrase [Ottowia testudinis]|uniref:Site-specific integrase n=1 Tax=Ottowia testudinis TaxID=2816950 RepID=A0A975CG23_9BURK|nr:site-specific integrase [Ottowia testudinis]QTD44212.1 site-specific integrase [Ottowia testudinis]
MAKPVGLNKRGNRYYLRVIIPDDLSGLYGGKAGVNPALGTADRAEAHIRGHALRARWEAEFAAKRRTLSPDPLPSVTPELAATLAARIRHRVLLDDDRLRSDPLLRADLRHYRAAAKTRQANPLAIIEWAPPDAPEDADGLSGATADELTAMADTNAAIDGDAAVNMAARNLAAVMPLVKAEALALGLSFDVAAPGARDALLACLGAYRKAWHEVTQRDAGSVVDTPPMPVAARAPAPASVKTLRDVYERWKVSGDTPKGADNLASVDRALRKFEGQHPNLSLNAITRDMGDQYRSWIRTQFNTPKTARDSLDRVKSLMNYAAETLQWTDRNAWRGLSIKATTTNKRRPWREDELTALFAAPVFTRYELPEDAKAGRDGAYWVPLLGIFTGARPGELCQLRVADVLEVEGVPCIRITDDGEGQADKSVKTAAGHRMVPLNSELIRLGFLGYVAAMRAAGHDGLWPQMMIRADRKSDYFGRWFGTLKASVGLPKAGYPDFYCFRHTVRPLMRRAGFSEETQDRVTGHESRGSVGTVVYGHWGVADLRPAVEAIRFPFLSLPVVSPHAGAG